MVIVSQSLVRHYWKNADPIGKRIATERGDSAMVIAVVADARQRLDAPVRDEL